jgi:hypothetical protein
MERAPGGDLRRNVCSRRNYLKDKIAAQEESIKNVDALKQGQADVVRKLDETKRDYDRKLAEISAKLFLIEQKDLLLIRRAIRQVLEK